MIKKAEKEKIERVTLKLPKSIADFFRKEFPHGKRSEFVAKSLLEYKHQKEIDSMEEKLKKVGKKRQIV